MNAIPPSTGLNNFTLGDLIAGFNQNGMGICIIGLPERSLNNLIPAILPQNGAQIAAPAALTPVPAPNDDNSDTEISDDETVENSIPEISREKSLGGRDQRILRTGKTIIITRKHPLRSQRPKQPQVPKKSRNKTVDRHNKWTREELRRLQNYTSDFTFAPDADYARKIAGVLKNRSPSAIRSKVSRMMKKLERSNEDVIDNSDNNDGESQDL
jgi:hypothetical protein